MIEYIHRTNKNTEPLEISMDIVDYVSVRRCVANATQEHITEYLNGMKEQGHIVVELNNGEIKVYNKYLTDRLIAWIR